MNFNWIPTKIFSYILKVEKECIKFSRDCGQTILGSFHLLISIMKRAENTALNQNTLWNQSKSYLIFMKWSTIFLVSEKWFKEGTDEKKSKPYCFSIYVNFSHRQSADKFILFVVLLAIGLEIPRFFQLRLVKNNTDFWTTDLMEDPVYIQVSWRKSWLVEIFYPQTKHIFVGKCM